MSGGRGRIRAISGHLREPLTTGWSVASTPPGAIDAPDTLAHAGLDWISSTVPSTAASTLAAAGRWNIDGPARDFDGEDWWYRTTFAAPAAEARRGEGSERCLAFDGLATIATVWLNGRELLSSHGMFAAHECPVESVLREENDLVICFRSLGQALAVRRPRPRWRVPMLEQQQLRWHRSTLLGRTPGWSPPAAAVGPWRAVFLEQRSAIRVGDVRLRARADGSLDVSCAISQLDGKAVSGVEIVVERSGRAHRGALTIDARTLTARGRLVVAEVERWWPHTHGDAPLYDARLVVSHAGGSSDVELGTIGFRTVSRDSAGGDFSVRVNDVPVFCRGALWTPLDASSLDATPEALDGAFAQVVDAGMNMLRVPGTTIYESDDFLDRCDRHGVMLWQDFMFASMDYPADDAPFRAEVEREVAQQLLRWQGRPSLAVLCGNSEGDQQAAMWGAARDLWSPPLFHEAVARHCTELSPDVPYTPSSASGGAFPHQPAVGATSYYGVGAYLRPLEDARRAEVRFASECLAFAHVPSAASVAATPSLRSARVHHPAWKERVPRDLGAGWDFEDVRDHYLALLFDVDPVRLRSVDHARYLELSRIVTGEVMADAIGEWRRGRSVTRGALILSLRDLRRGAGWGVVGAEGEPKPAWFYLRRAMAPLALALTDEGCNGLDAHVANDRPVRFVGSLEVTLLRGGDQHVECVSTELSVAPHATHTVTVGALFDHFVDLNHAFHFAPPSHELVAATLRDATGRAVSHAWHFVGGRARVRERDVGLTARVEVTGESAFAVHLTTRRFAQAVNIDVPGFAPDDNYMHLLPGATRIVALRALHSGVLPVGTAQPANCEASTRIAPAE